MLFCRMMAAEPRENPTDEPTAPPLHVLHVAEYDVFVRFGRMLRHVALAQNAEGLRVTLLTDDGVAAADLEGTPVECHWVRRLSGWLAWRLPRELDQRLEPRPQIVHLWGSAGWRPVGEWALHNGIPVLLHVLSMADIGRLRRRLGARPEVLMAAGCAEFARRIRERLAALVERPHILRPALLMPDSSADDEPADHTLGILWAGRIDADAGLATLVDAAAQLRRQGRDLQVALVGSGPGVRDVWEHIRRVQVHDCVSLVDEPRLWDRTMRGVDVCVVPTRQDDLALAPLLAMALGKVVLASRDQVAEWFIDDQTAWLFAPGSAVELAYYLARVAERDRHAAELRRSAAEYVRAHHTVGHLVENLIAAYRYAVERRQVNLSAAGAAAGSGQP